MDDDDECMESDFRTLQKEEYRSAKAGKISLIVLLKLVELKCLLKTILKYSVNNFIYVHNTYTCILYHKFIIIKCLLKFR